MDAQETTNITVIIAGRSYPLKIKVGDESNVRAIVKEVNEKINRFQMTYSNKDKQDCLSMALFTYAIDLHKSRQATNHKELSTKITDIDQFLDQLL